jgi:hypothetical protein
MNVSQNISAIFNSPEIAAVALQAVQAGEMAERQDAILLAAEERRREHQVTGSREASTTDGVAPHSPDTQAASPRARRKARPAAAPAPEDAAEADSTQAGPGDGHRINLMA